MTKSRQVADFGAGGFYAGKNKIINGDFGIWQRGTSVSLTNNTTAYTTDRWYIYTSFSAGSSSVSQQTFTPGSAPVAGYEGSTFARFTAGSTATYFEFGQRIEDVRVFAGQTATFSFWAKASTNTTVSGTLVQNFGSGGSTAVSTAAGAYAITTSWQRFSATVSVPSISGKTIGTSSFLNAVFAANTLTGSQTIDFWGVQLEAGSVATPFTTASGTFQGELALCQRYFWRYGIAIADTPYVDGRNRSTTSFRALIRHPVTMRGNPTFASSTVSNFAIYEQSNAYTVTSLVSTDLSPTGTGIQASVTSGLTSGYASSLLSSPGITTSYMDFSAEL